MTDSYDLKLFLYKETRNFKLLVYGGKIQGRISS
jgi:hypothetical protein